MATQTVRVPVCFRGRMQMELGFYDTTRTGEITSRLAADTSSVSDSVCLNLNVILRSATQAAMVLGFMFSAQVTTLIE